MKKLVQDREPKSEDELIRQSLLHSREDRPLLELAMFYESQGDSMAELIHVARKWGKTGCKKALRKLQDKARWPEGELLKRILPPPYGVNSEWGTNCPPRLAPEEGAITAAQLDGVEQMIGMKLPVDYRAYMLNYGGSRPEPSGFKIPGCVDMGMADGMVKRIFGMTKATNSGPDEFAENWEIMLKRRRLDWSWRRRPRCNFVPVGTIGVYHGLPHWICVEGGDEVSGKVFLVPANTPPHCNEVADTFGEFLHMLADYTPDCVALIKAGDVVRLQRWLSSTREDTEERERSIKVIQHAVTQCPVDAVTVILKRRAKANDRNRAAEHCDCQEVVDLLRSVKTPCLSNC